MDPNFETAQLYTIKVEYNNNGKHMFVSNHGRYVVYAHFVNSIIYDTQQRTIRKPVTDSIKDMMPVDITDDGEYLLLHLGYAKQYCIAHWNNYEYSIIFDYLIDSIDSITKINDQNNLLALFFHSTDPIIFTSSVVIQLFSIGNPVNIKWTFSESGGVGYPTLTFSEDGRYLIVSYVTGQSTNGFKSRMILFSVDSPKILASWNFTDDMAPVVDTMQVGQDLYIVVGCRSLYLFVYR